MRTILAIALAITACKGNDPAKPAPATTVTPRPIDAAPAPPAIGDRTIRRDGVGPITAATPATVEALMPLFPGADVVPSANRGDAAEVNDSPRIEIGDQLMVPLAKGTPTVTDVEVIADGYATAAKIHVGSTVAELAAGEPTAQCNLHASDNVNELTCYVPGTSQIVYSVEDGGYGGKAGPTATADIARRVITQITWRAR